MDDGKALIEEINKRAIMEEVKRLYPEGGVMGRKAKIEKIIDTVLEYAYADVFIKNPENAPDIDVLIRDRKKLVEELEKLV